MKDQELSASGKKIKNVDLNAPDEKAVKKALAIRPSESDKCPQGIEECCVRQFWAVVETDGTLIRGRNVFRVKKLPSPGQYEVYFTGDISNGVFVATIGRPGIATEPPGEIGVALRCCPNSKFEENRGVWIDTHDSNGRPSDRAFHLMVLTQ